jgi:hypothetical protein
MAYALRSTSPHVNIAWRQGDSLLAGQGLRPVHERHRPIREPQW